MELVSYFPTVILYNTFYYTLFKSCNEKGNVMLLQLKYFLIYIQNYWKKFEIFIKVFIIQKRSIKKYIKNA